MSAREKFAFTMRLHPGMEAEYRARHDSITHITAGPNAGARSAYVADPDGYYIELFQKKPDAA